jgi:imidazolonepropionase-like amidohydrolase
MVKHGVDVIEHGGTASDDTVRLLVEKGTFIVTTLSPLILQAEQGHLWDMPAWKVEERRQAVAEPHRYDGLVACAKAGVPIVFGTDAGSPVVPHDAIAPELRFMVDTGICPNNEDALVSITSRSALMNGLAEDRGALHEGLAADVIVVDGNPLEDLQAIDNVEMVFLDGARIV